MNDTPTNTPVDQTVSGGVGLPPLPPLPEIPPTPTTPPPVPPTPEQDVNEPQSMNGGLPPVEVKTETSIPPQAKPPKKVNTKLIAGAGIVTALVMVLGVLAYQFGGFRGEQRSKASCSAWQVDCGNNVCYQESNCSTQQTFESTYPGAGRATWEQQACASGTPSTWNCGSGGGTTTPAAGRTCSGSYPTAQCCFNQTEGAVTCGGVAGTCTVTDSTNLYCSFTFAGACTANTCESPYPAGGSGSRKCNSGGTGWVHYTGLNCSSAASTPTATPTSDETIRCPNTVDSNQCSASQLSNGSRCTDYNGTDARYYCCPAGQIVAGGGCVDPHACGGGYACVQRSVPSLCDGVWRGAGGDYCSGASTVSGRGNCCEISATGTPPAGRACTNTSGTCSGKNIGDKIDNQGNVTSSNTYYCQCTAPAGSTTCSCTGGTSGGIGGPTGSPTASPTATGGGACKTAGVACSPGGGPNECCATSNLACTLQTARTTDYRCSQVPTGDQCGAGYSCDRINAYRCSALDSQGQCHDNLAVNVGSWGAGLAHTGGCGQVDYVCSGGPRENLGCGNFQVISSSCGAGEGTPQPTASTPQPTATATESPTATVTQPTATVTAGGAPACASVRILKDGVLVANLNSLRMGDRIQLVVMSNSTAVTAGRFIVKVDGVDISNGGFQTTSYFTPIRQDGLKEYFFNHTIGRAGNYVVEGYINTAAPTAQTCRRCSNTFAHMMTEWQAVDCMDDPNQINPPITVNRTYFGDCPANENVTRQCHRCSTNNEGEYVWWLKVGDESCETSPTLTRARIYAGPNVSCHKQAGAPTVTRQPTATATVTASPTATATQQPTATPTELLPLGPTTSQCSRCSNAFDYQRVSWQSTSCTNDPPAGVTVTRSFDGSCGIFSTTTKTCSRCSDQTPGQYIWWKPEVWGTSCAGGPGSATVYQAPLATCTTSTSPNCTPRPGHYCPDEGGSTMGVSSDRFSLMDRVREVLTRWIKLDQK